MVLKCNQMNKTFRHEIKTINLEFHIKFPINVYDDPFNLIDSEFVISLVSF